VVLARDSGTQHAMYSLCLVCSTGELNVQDSKMQDWHMTDEVARVENDGLEIGGPENGGLDKAGLEIAVWVYNSFRRALR